MYHNRALFEASRSSRGIGLKHICGLEAGSPKLDQVVCVLYALGVCSSAG